MRFVDEAYSYGDQFLHPPRHLAETSLPRLTMRSMSAALVFANFCQARNSPLYFHILTTSCGTEHVIIRGIPASSTCHVSLASTAASWIFLNASLRQMQVVFDNGSFTQAILRSLRDFYPAIMANVSCNAIRSYFSGCSFMGCSQGTLHKNDRPRSVWS